jgi:hypothetical protein
LAVGRDAKTFNRVGRAMNAAVWNGCEFNPLAAIWADEPITLGWRAEAPDEQIVLHAALGAFAEVK